MEDKQLPLEIEKKFLIKIKEQYIEKESERQT